MPIHFKKDILEELTADIYGCTEVNLSVPKYRFPQKQLRPDVAYSLVRDELILDGNARQNLATFCQTWVEDEVHQLMDLAIDKNMIDKDEYPSTAEREKRCVHMLADLWNSPQAAKTLGCSTTGSSEAAMLGGLALKWKWRKAREKANKPADKPNLITGPVQVCWHKFARYFDVELREIPMEKDRFCMNPEEVLKRVDENTIGVVCTFGLTFTGQYEPVLEIARALDKLEKDTGLNIPIHVDAASGGFLAPFVEPDLLWDFRIPRVRSINASGHKYGLAPLGVGWIIWHDASDLPEELIFWVNYLGGKMPTFALNFSRPAGQIIAQYYNFLRLGREGYRCIQQNCYQVAQYLAKEIAKLGPFDLIFDGDSSRGIPVVSWRIKEGENPGYTLFELSDRLRTRGWQVPAYTLPPRATDIAIMRIVVRHGFSLDLAEMLLEDFRRSLDYLQKHPVSTPVQAEEGASFNHHAWPGK
ncbi:MAG TPA: glutamate decarboxylase [Desulfonauticus sp.]|jgi:glutamate decarboxylase|nr:MAG: Glutamate decarboxylase alpha/beta [Desulfonauticus sp. 38_4375]MDK2920888.1 glutamate decarboxylase [Desulfonauticus sp.]HCO12137.1 glutamate decarboxylase [Desulfonauticus sp.]